MSVQGAAPQDLVAHLSRHFGCDPARASASFVGVDVIEVLRFTVGIERFYVSVGMSGTQCVRLAPQTAPAGSGVVEEMVAGELVLRVRASNPSGFADAWRSVALLAAAPVVEEVRYRVDMTVDLGRGLASSATCTGALLGDSGVPDALTDTAVRFLELTPATAAELAWCRLHNATGLRERWAMHRTDLRDLGRPSVDLG